MNNEPTRIDHADYVMRIIAIPPPYQEENINPMDTTRIHQVYLAKLNCHERIKNHARP